MIRIRLLGGLELTETDRGSVLSVLSQPKRVALLSYLLIAQPRGYHTRDKLLALFWPEADEDHARNSLRQSLHFLRRSLGEDVVLTRGEGVAIDPSQFSCDVLAFEQAIDGGQWESALEAYRGPFLEGFHVSGVPAFDRWLESRRERLRFAAAEAAAAWAQEEEEKGRITVAIKAARRWVQLSPASGVATQKLIHLMALKGDRASALRIFERFRARLREDFGLEPSEDLERFVDTVRQGKVIGRSVPRALETPAVTEKEGPPGATGGAPEPDAGDPTVPVEPAAPVDPAAFQAAGPSRPPESRPSTASRITGPRGTWTIVVFVSMIALGYAFFFTRGVDHRVGVLLKGFTDSRPTTEQVEFSQALLLEIAQVMDSSEVLRPVTDESDFRFLQYGWIRGDTVELMLADLDPQIMPVEWAYPVHALPLTTEIRTLAIAIVRDIETAVAGRSNLSLPSPGTANPDAAEAYLKGRALWALRDPGAFGEAQRYFERALEADSSYGFAYAALADVFNLLGTYDYGLLHPDTAYRRAMAAATKAESFESGSAEALTALATSEFFYEWDTAQAERHYRDALRDDSTYVSAHQWLSLLLGVQGRFEEADIQIAKAMQIDSSVVLPAARARIAYFARNFRDALSWYDKALEEKGDFVPAHLGKGLTALMAGGFQMAWDAYEEAERSLGGPAPVILAVKGHYWGKVGQPDRAREFLRHLEQVGMEGGFVPPEYFAMVHVGLNEYDQAMNYLEAAFNNGSNVMTILEVEPLLDPLRTNERFQSLEDRVWEGRIR